MVAGTAPPARTAASTSSAAARLSGRGSPWASSVLSSATTGRPALSASATSGERTVRREGRGRGVHPVIMEGGILRRDQGGSA